MTTQKPQNEKLEKTCYFTANKIRLDYKDTKHMGL